MAAVTTWTGLEANALRKALRMSVTDFAEHLGAARRTVVKWSSRGAGIQLRADMQAALDTVLARASPEVRERFETLRDEGKGTSGAPVEPSGTAALPRFGTAADTHEAGQSSLVQDGDVRRRDLLAGAALSGVAVLPDVAPLLDILVSPSRTAAPPVSGASMEQLAQGVATAKTEYQACRYERVLARLVTLLPAMDTTRAEVGSDARLRLDALATDLYHVVGSVLLKLGDRAMALMAAERSTRFGLASEDPVAMGASARIMTHALMSNGYTDRAMQLAQTAADALDRATRLDSPDAVSVYGALVLRGAIAAARADNRDLARSMLDEASATADRLGHDGNDRWTGFGVTNVLLHRVNVALALGDAGTAVTLARQVQIDKITLAERRASLFVDVAQAYTQWGRYEQGLSALRTAYRVAPEEVRFRPTVQRLVTNLAVLTRGHMRADVAEFAAITGIRA